MKPIPKDSFGGIVSMLKCIADETRIQILQILAQNERVSVGEIVNNLKMSQPNISKHLQVLYHGGLVESEKEGTTVYYFLSDSRVMKICDAVCENYKIILGKKAKNIKLQLAQT